MYGTWVCLSVWCEGGHFTLVPNILKIIYGDQATSLYGIMFTYTGVCGLLMLGLLSSRLGQEYIIFWILTSVLSGISLLLLLLVFNQKRFVGSGCLTPSVEPI
jgi:hypothetical protein